jgi:hypothetical protein
MKYTKGTFNTVPNKNHLRGKPAEMQSIYFWIVDHADENGECFPSRDTLANESGCNIKTVDKYIKLLIEQKFITKTQRKKKNSNKHASNIYQLLLIDDIPFLPDLFTNNGTEPRTENGAVTIPSINYTHITTSSEEESSQILTGKLPDNRGKTYILRVISIYRDLFKDKYGFDPKINIGLFGKKVKELSSQYSELQIAAMLIVFFNWGGMDGSDSRTRQRLLDSSHSPNWFFSTTNSYEVYLRNVCLIKFDDEDEVRSFVGRTMLELNK